MSKFRTAIAATGLVLAAALPASAGQYAGPGFSAEIWLDLGTGEYQEAGRIYVDRIGVRMEVSPMGPKVVNLMIWDAPTVYHLRPDLGLYYEEPSRMPDTGFTGEPCYDYSNGEKLGLETANGGSTEKWRCTGQLRAPSGVPVDATRWHNRELNFWVREVTDRGAAMELRNIEIGRQEPSLFEIPADFEKASR